jgi:arylsulfatase B
VDKAGAFHGSQGSHCRGHVPLCARADDLGFNEVGFRNASRGLQTPHLDALAAQGVILDRYYTTPLCTPSRSSFMTGLYTHGLGTQSNVIYWDTPWAVPPHHRFLPELLKRHAGYGATALFGKWHLGMHRQAAFPTSRGFDVFQGFLQGGGSHGTHVSACVGPPPDPLSDATYVCPGPAPGQGKDYRGYDWFENTQPQFAANGTSSTHLIRDLAVQFIHAHSKDASPFFLALSFQNVHEPIACSPAAYALFQHLPVAEPAKLLYGYLWDLDAAVGAVVRALEDTGLFGLPTMVVFASDNGAPPVWGAGGRNWPLAGFKSQTWEGGVRVPAFVVAPGRVPPGSRTTEYVHVTDWVPTLMSAANAAPPRGLDGHDAWPLLQGLHGASGRREFVVNINPLTGGQFGAPRAAFVHGHLKVLCWAYSVRGIAGANGTGCHLWPPPFLFNITADPGETRNLAPSCPDLVQHVLSRMDALATPCVEPMQWAAPYQGPRYPCAACPLHPAGTGPFHPWTWWL